MPMRCRSRYIMRCRARLPLLHHRIFPFLSSCHRSQTTQVTPAHSNYSTHQFSPTRVDFSSTDCSGISKDVICQCPHIFGLKEKPFTKPASLKGLFLDLSDVMPEIARKFRRCSRLKSEDVLEILLGFQAEAGKVTLGARKVETLWEIFKWASDQRKDIKHLPRSYEIMASLLVRSGLLTKFELLLLAMEMQGVQLGCHEIFSNSIEAYLAAGDLGKALILFERMKKRKLVPSLPCFNAFVHALIQRKRTQQAFHLCLHMVEMSVNMSVAEKPSFENVIRLLCLDGRIHEARNLLKLTPWRSEPSAQVINEIALGYCKKKDFDDLQRFLAETKCLPDLIVCNKIIHTLCCDFSIERAELFRQELEHVGFSPNEITLGILLSWSCRVRNLRSAFLFLSEILARGLNPDLLSYNAVIASVFMEGLWNLAQDILDEMLERGTKPNLSTFEVLLAGYCRERKFEEAKLTVLRMVDLGLVNSNSPQDHLSQAFATLGFSPSVVRLRRDNHVGFSKAEFCDTIGNGLYLDTDLDEYDERLSNILKEHAALDFNSLVMKECCKGNFKTALRIAEKTISWGQELFFPTCLDLLKGLSVSLSEMKAVTRLLDKTPIVANQLNSELLNLIVQAYCKKGWAYKGSKLFYEMVQKDLMIKTETYTALIRGLCKRGFSKELMDCWDSARRNKWLPSLKDYKVLTRCLLYQDMLKEALELFEEMIFSYHSLRLEICHLFIEELCDDGLTSIAHTLVKLLSQRHCVLHLTSYSYLARALWKKKKKSDALAVLDIMISGSDLGGSVNRAPWLCGSDGFHQEMIAENTKSKAQFALQKDLLPDIGVYDIVFEVHCLAENVKKSRELLCLMIKDNVHLSTSVYRSWVRLMCTADKVTSVLAMKKFVLQQSPSSSLIFYNILVFYLLSARRSSMVAKVLNEMQEKGLLPDEVTYNFLVHGFSVCGDMPSSVLYLFTMISKGLRPSNHSLKIVMRWLFQIGDVKDAFGLSQEMELRGWPHCSVVQDLVAGALIGQGKFWEAESYLDRLVDKGLLLGTVNYNNLIRKFCSCGRMERAVDLLNIMLKKQNLPDLATYESVIYGFCARNELNRAMVFHNEMLDLGIQPSIRMWETLVFQFCEEGRTAEAEECIVSMVCCGQTPTREMYVEVIEKYRSENKVKKVSEMMQRMQESGYEPDFDTHWSLISKLSSSGNGSSSDGFLLRLLSGSGFISKKPVI